MCLLSLWHKFCHEFCQGCQLLCWIIRHLCLPCTALLRSSGSHIQIFFTVSPGYPTAISKSAYFIGWRNGHGWVLPIFSLSTLRYSGWFRKWVCNQTRTVRTFPWDFVKPGAWKWIVFSLTGGQAGRMLVQKPCVPSCAEKSVCYRRERSQQILRSKD